MNDNSTFEIAQALRNSHCDRKQDKDHVCVGEMTIKRGEICLNCQLCGKGEEIPGWNHAAAESVKAIFQAAGFDWDSLNMEAKRQSVIEFSRQKKFTT